MIWCRGEILPDDALRISVADRTFEHGLGLFETLRTWNGRPVLLEAHRARMFLSARELGLTMDPRTFPDESAVGRLVDVEGHEGDRLLRITATGGVGPEPSTIWMRSGPLSTTFRSGAIVARDGLEVSRSDRLARFKSLNYWARRRAFEAAVEAGFDEALVGTSGGWLEGSRSNLFLIQDGEIRTPSLSWPIVPGVMRAVIRDVAAEEGIPWLEGPAIAPDQLSRADEVFLSNAVRGIMPVAGIGHPSDDPASIRWIAPGPLTSLLQNLVARKLGIRMETP